MGNILKKEKHIRVFRNSIDYEEVKNSIFKSKVYHDCDFLFFIDCTKSNMYIDGTTRHDITRGDCKCTRQTISNPYFCVLDIIKEFPFQTNTKFSLFFFGTHKANNSDNKLETINFSINDEENKVYQNESNIYNNFNEMIDGYIIGVNSILDKNEHIKWGNNYFCNGTPLLEILDESIKYVKNIKKFSVAIILLDGFSNDINKNYINKFINKLIEATNYPLEIIFVGIGGDDFKILEGFDDYNYKKMGISKKKLNILEKNRKFDNFRTLIFKKKLKRTLINKYIREEIFRCLFAELPQVYNYIQKKSIIGYVPNININSQHSIHDLENYYDSVSKTGVMVLNLKDNYNGGSKNDLNKVREFNLRNSLKLKLTYNKIKQENELINKEKYISMEKNIINKKKDIFYRGRYSTNLDKKPIEKEFIIGMDNTDDKNNKDDKDDKNDYDKDNKDDKDDKDDKGVNYNINSN